MDEAITFSANLAARGIQFWLWSVDTILQGAAVTLASHSSLPDSPPPVQWLRTCWWHALTTSH